MNSLVKPSFPKDLAVDRKVFATVQLQGPDDHLVRHDGLLVINMARAVAAEAAGDRLAARADVGVLAWRALCDEEILLRDDRIARVWPAGEESACAAMAELASCAARSMRSLRFRKDSAEANLPAVASALFRARVCSVDPAGQGGIVHL